MGCKPKRSKCQQTYRNKKSVIKVVEEEDIPSENLREKGRIQYFYHSPLSELPVRDVSNEQCEGHKTEPHIEIGIENYLAKCRQTNIIAHLNSDEKYLFLVTTCRNENMDEHDVPYIVGYMVKERHFVIENEKRHAVKGETLIFPFSKSVPYYDIFPERFAPLRLVDENKTEEILKHFKGKRDKTPECVEEIIRLDKNNKKRDKTCIVLRGSKCKYQNECLRWKTQ